MNNNYVSDIEKHKQKIRMIIQNKGMCSMMNNTKWRELKKEITELPFLPPFVIKSVDEEESTYHQFDEDVYHTGDWGLYLENYLGGDIYATPFYAVEWIKIRPRLLKHQGRLVESKVIDETDEFLEMLKKFNIPFEEQNGTYIIYGYK
ncbi:MAG: hypothetical protein IJP10_05660 [Clostridia bacterium]|nr:hypothetical protein [Clostridia bacterium]